MRDLDPSERTFLENLKKSPNDFDCHTLGLQVEYFARYVLEALSGMATSSGRGLHRSVEMGMNTRRLWIALTCLNTAVVAVLLLRSATLSAASDPEVLRAQRIELVDQEGRVRGQLNVEPSGEAVFRLRDSKGEIRVKLGAGEDGSGLLLLDGTTEPRIHMLAKEAGTSVTLTSRSGQRRVIAP